MNEQKEILEHPVFESYWLSHAKADTVFEWLRNQKPDFGFVDEEIVKMLIERHEPLINLGLALYVNVTNHTALHLFRIGDMTIKKAVLAGPSHSLFLDHWTEEFGVLKELLQSFDHNIELLGFLLSNRFIPQGLLTSLYERSDPFNGLTDEQWLKAIKYTVLNPAISALDDSPTEHIHRTRDAAWNLFAILPVNEGSAIALARLGEILAPRGERITRGAPTDMDVLATIKRWEIETEDEFSDFRACRAALGRLLNDEALKDSDDIALRQEYYYRGNWNSGKPEEVREAFEKDKSKFLKFAVENLSFYWNEHVRNELGLCCSDYQYKDEYHNQGDAFLYSMPRSHFEKQCNLLKQKHPERFPNFHGEIPFDEVSDLSLRANKRLEFLQEQIKAISQELIGTKSEDDNSSWYDEDKASLIENIKTTLDQANQLVLSKLASVTAWMVFAGIVFAIILIVILIKM